ncbi:MAG: hypothetical protein MR333_01820 [Porphyromonadaceae bacterium]|nr:hypothetical protein [Porphyromonadaceae bacterium]
MFWYCASSILKTTRRSPLLTMWHNTVALTPPAIYEPTSYSAVDICPDMGAATVQYPSCVLASLRRACASLMEASACRRLDSAWITLIFATASAWRAFCMAACWLR